MKAIATEIAQQVASTILGQIRAGIGAALMMSWGVESRAYLAECKIPTDKGVITAPAFGGGVLLNTINHTIGGEQFRLVRVFVIYNRVPDDYTIVITAPQMDDDIDDEVYYNTPNFTDLVDKTKPERLLYKNTGFYCDDLGRIIDGVIESNQYKPNYGEVA
jgi:hypothetical protein